MPEYLALSPLARKWLEAGKLGIFLLTILSFGLPTNFKPPQIDHSLRLQIGDHRRWLKTLGRYSARAAATKNFCLALTDWRVFSRNFQKQVKSSGRWKPRISAGFQSAGRACKKMISIISGFSTGFRCRHSTKHGGIF
jgi:hypothetical protein